MTRWTPKGKPKDGHYYDGTCSQHGDVQVVAFGNGGQHVACSHPDANNDCKAEIIEVPE